jgi:16S rRNA processing protein RimM
VPRSELPVLDEGEHYLVDLVGLQVRLEDGTAIGVVEETIEYPAAQVLRVRVSRGVVEVPMFEPYLVAIEFEQGAVVVRHVDELDVEPDRR